MISKSRIIQVWLFSSDPVLRTYTIKLQFFDHAVTLCPICRRLSRGAQAQLSPNTTPRVPGISRLGELEDRTTVQGLFNVALKRFKPANTPVLVLSSR